LHHHLINQPNPININCRLARVISVVARTYHGKGPRLTISVWVRMACLCREPMSNCLNHWPRPDRLNRWTELARLSRGNESTCLDRRHRPTHLGHGYGPTHLGHRYGSTCLGKTSQVVSDVGQGWYVFHEPMPKRLGRWPELARLDCRPEQALRQGPTCIDCGHELA